ncbi:MAG TPA: glucosyl-3-phosphoglycerate synthase [Solirubrobacteraceae bacterium]|jgi:glucosyl-3-phosphoglycerate synthase|nr:glucosyl-3-phosphoglycerate synthase [Solirubrobacteraceae bacterium]
MSLRLRSWLQTNTHGHGDFSGTPWTADRDTISVCLPARNEARTIGLILAQLTPLLKRGLIDQLVVVDDSTDGTAELARSAGAEVYDQQLLMPDHGPVLGKGDAMWRSLPVLRGEIVCFLDADSEQFGPHFPLGLVGPLLVDRDLAFVKGFYRRPFRIGDVVLPDGGGRVTELCARPLLNLFYPELAGVRQPLAGEIAARRELLEQLPFVTGYGVDIALLIDAYATVGLEGIAQVDLDVRQNDHQPLRDLGGMAYAVLQAVCARLEREGRLSGELPDTLVAFDDLTPSSHASPLVERPPLARLRAAA